jgi:hypothetical protein
MIVSCSRRTDIPAFYADWLFARLRAGFVCVRNPRNPRQVSQIALTPDAVDGFVFWTKNPAPMLDRLRELQRYAYYFQFTLTPYGRDVEPNLPDKIEILRTFQRLSETVGPDRVLWRYDPIVISQTYSPDAHLRQFEELARTLSGFTRRVTLSFLDTGYRNVKRNAQRLSAEPLPVREKLALAGRLAQIARNYGMEPFACAQETDFSACGIAPGRCVDAALLEAQLGCRLRVRKDPNQRPACGCAASVDIGAYNTCAHGCLYCYANYNAGEIAINRQKHDPGSPLLVGEPGPEEPVTQRRMASCRDGQIGFTLKVKS